MRTGLWDGPIRLDSLLNAHLRLVDGKPVVTNAAGNTATVKTTSSWEGLIAWPGTTG